MKNSILKFFGILTIATSLLVGCSSSDDDNAPSSSFVVDANDFKGMINDGEVILDASTVYKLTGRLQVNAGAVLTICSSTCCFNSCTCWNS